MIAELTARLKSLIDKEATGPARGDNGLRRLLEDATLFTLATNPPIERTEWLRYGRAILERSSQTAPPDDVLARLRLAIAASQVSAAGGKSSEQLDESASDLDSLIDTLETVGATRAASIGHLVAGHLFLYARNPQGFRAGLLEDAEKHFAAADDPDCDEFVRAFAKLRSGETGLVGRRTNAPATVMASHENFADALEFLDRTTDGINSSILERIRAEARAALGASSFLLSTAGGEHQQALRQLAIDHLAAAIAGADGLPVGEERWAKAALMLALAWSDESLTSSMIASEMGVGLESFADADKKARLALREIVRKAHDSAPEVWARAHVYLAQFAAADKPGAVRQNVRHFEAALTVFGKLEYPETWSAIEGQLGTTLLNAAAMRRDARGITEGLKHYELATQANDPIRDTERNACRRWADVLIQLERWDEATTALEQAMDAGEFVLARAQTIPAQRAESGILSSIVKELAVLLARTGKHKEALSRLIYSTELDFAYGLLFAATGQPPDEFELLDRIQLGQTAIEGAWNDCLPFARTGRELNAIRLEVGERVAAIVREATNERRRIVADRLKRIFLEAQVPADGALVVPLVTESNCVFVVMLGSGESVPEMVPAPYAARQGFLEAVFGAGLREGWLAAYLRSLVVREEAGTFGDHPAILTSHDRVLSVNFLPGQAQDPAEMMPKETWVPALDTSTSAAWYLLEPLYNHLDGRLRPGAPVIFVGEPLLAMLPLAAAWRHVSSKARDLAEDWSIGLVPAASLLSPPEDKFRIDSDDSALVVVDPTGDLAFAEWEYIAIAAAHPNLKISALGARRGGIKKAILKAIGNSSIHHFACHAQYENSNPLDSFIDLGGNETITAREIVAELGLQKSKLVVLSACESAMINTSTSHPERYVGLATAFLEAGAERVISTLWSVNDVSTMLLMQALYEGLAEQPPIVALRNAQLRIRDMSATKAAAALRHLGQRRAEMPKSSSVRPKSDALDELIALFADLGKAAKPFEHAFHWGAFVHYGAPR
jgi:CHAT domain-containing protein/tetratricopeptide (TPR) repeat protein